MTMTLKYAGLKCISDNECRILQSSCSPMGFCECKPGMFFDLDLTACVRVMGYNERCSPDMADECRNDHMTCSELLGICKCETGFKYVPGWSPFCQPGNASACPIGQVWSDIQSMCIPRPVDVWVESGAYDRNRYSLFFAVLLILILMVILFKSKKPHPNPFPFGFTSQPVSQHSCRDHYDDDVVSVDELDLRLAEAGLVYLSPHRTRIHHHHSRIPNLSESSDGYCVAYQPPPSYSSTLDLSRLDRREKPPPYEEAILMPLSCPLNQDQSELGSAPNVQSDDSDTLTIQVESCAPEPQGEPAAGSDSQVPAAITSAHEEVN